MSSHHIVRDQQEPALILADVDAFPFDLLGQLLEWAPYTVCGDAALDQALKYEINLDVVFSARPKVEEQLTHFPGVELEQPNENWMEEAIELLASKGHRAVNVLVGDAFTDLDVMHSLSSLIMVDIITPKIKYVRVEKSFSKWLPASSRVVIVGLGCYELNGDEMTANDITTGKEGVIHISGLAPFILGSYSF